MWFNFSVDSEWFNCSVDSEWFHSLVYSDLIVQCSPAGVPQLKPCGFIQCCTLAPGIPCSHEFYNVIITVAECNPIMGLLKEPAFSKHIYYNAYSFVQES